MWFPTVIIMAVFFNWTNNLENWKDGGNVPRTKSQPSGNKQLPANQQKGKKVCTCCHEEKNMTDFYFSSSPIYSLDELIPVCKECCKTSVLTEDWRIDFDKFKDLLRNIDKPLYFDLLFSSEESVKKENSYLSDEEVSLHGYEILQKYFTLVAMRQDESKQYSIPLSTLISVCSYILNFVWPHFDHTVSFWHSLTYFDHIHRFCFFFIDRMNIFVICYGNIGMSHQSAHDRNINSIPY